MIYLVCFLASSIIFDCSLNCKKIVRCIGMILSISIVVLLAALRDVSVGTDVMVYAKPFSDMALTQSFFSYMTIALRNGIEIGYLILVYISSHLFDGIVGVLGVTQLVIIWFVYMRIKDFKGICPIWLMTLIYLLMFYNQSLNIMRQSMAMAIVFFGTRYLGKNNYRYVQMVILACLFHISAVLGIVIYAIHSMANGKSSQLKVTVAFIGMLLFVVFFNQILSTIISMLPIDGSRYMTYLSGDSGYVNLWHTIFRILFVVAGLFIGNTSLNSICIQNENGTDRVLMSGINVKRYYLMLMIFSLLLNFLTLYDGDSYRFAQFFLMFTPQIIVQLRNKFVVGNRRVIDIVLLLLFIFYWWHFFIYDNEGRSYPYMIASML